MGLLFSMHLQKRTSALHIYSQPGLDEIITLQLKYSRSSLNYTLVFHSITSDSSDCILEDEHIRVYTIPLKHKVACTGFLFREKTKPRKINKERLPNGILLQHILQLKLGKDIYNTDGTMLYKNEDYTLPPRPSYSYAYCSDTVYDESLISSLKDINLLYHEATFMTAHKDKAAITLHSTSLQAARVARLAGVKHLVLGHFSARYRELEPLLEEAKSEFPNTQLAIEGETIDLESL
jgi:ribonuclease Z